LTGADFTSLIASYALFFDHLDEIGVTSALDSVLSSNVLTSVDFSRKRFRYVGARVSALRLNREVADESLTRLRNVRFSADRMTEIDRSGGVRSLYRAVLAGIGTLGNELDRGQFLTHGAPTDGDVRIIPVGKLCDFLGGLASGGVVSAIWELACLINGAEGAICALGSCACVILTSLGAVGLAAYYFATC
jgi:hypothetical protein